MFDGGYNLHMEAHPPLGGAFIPPLVIEHFSSMKKIHRAFTFSKSKFMSNPSRASRHCFIPYWSFRVITNYHRIILFFRNAKSIFVNFRDIIILIWIVILNKCMCKFEPDKGSHYNKDKKIELNWITHAYLS